MLKTGRGVKPDVVLVRLASGGEVVVKDYFQRSVFVRRVLAPYLLRREESVHEALRSHEAVPAICGRVDSLALVLEYRTGEPLSRALGAALGQERAALLMTRIEEAVAKMHELGVVHLDLRHRDNILCDAEARPVLLDFAGAMRFRPGSFFYRFYRPTVLRYDASALVKWRERLTPRSSR
jgi:serine/threonine protein kinase